jgi:hypothetical protein
MRDKPTETFSRRQKPGIGEADGVKVTATVLV